MQIVHELTLEKPLLQQLGPTMAEVHIGGCRKDTIYLCGLPGEMRNAVLRNELVASVVRKGWRSEVDTGQ